jgi:DNA-binding winged helix-turn-helix (wHTH) protein
MIAELVTRIQPPGKEPYLATYILVDRVDESNAGPGAALDILRPLVSETPVLETPHVGFKFFLPAGVAEELRKAVHLREDRMVIKRIEWDHEALVAMVDLRVRQFSSPIGYNESLADLCDGSARHKVMGKLPAASDNSPRMLLQLCSSLLHHHVLESNEPQIDLNTVLSTTRECEREREAERARESRAREDRASAQKEETSQAPQQPPEHGLYMDEDDQVWVDGKLLEKPLTRNEATLLRILYGKSPAVVSQDALIEGIWPESSFERDEQNLRKLVGRLRKRLVTTPGGDDTRFIKNAKGLGYRLERN